MVEKITGKDNDPCASPQDEFVQAISKKYFGLISLLEARFKSYYLLTGCCQAKPDARLLCRSSPVGNKNGGTVGLLKNFKSDLSEKLPAPTESLEPKNQEIRLIRELGDCGDNSRTLLDANYGYGWDFVAGQDFKRASFAFDIFSSELFRQNFQEDNLAGYRAVSI